MNITNQRGFALPTTIFLVTILTVMLAAAFVRTASDHQIADGSQFMEEALSVAQSGLQRYMESTSSRPSDGDSVRINVTNGYAWVKAHALQSPVDTMENETFVIASTGYVIEATQGSTPVAERTVAQMAFWQTGFITRPAAYTAANGIYNRRLSNSYFQGNVYTPDTLGLRVPSSPTPNMFRMTVSGQPTGMRTGGNAESVTIETGIDWQSIRDGDMECENTSIFSGLFNFSFESYCIDGNLTLNKYYGSGLLIVTGDLIITGQWNYAYWYGLILVGGRVRFNARYNRIYGALYSGLNEQIPSLPNVSRTRVGESNRYVYIYYYDNYVRASLAYLTGLVPIAGTWMDNWATY